MRKGSVRSGLLRKGDYIYHGDKIITGQVGSASFIMIYEDTSIRVYNNSGNGDITVQEYNKFAWHGQKPPATATVPSGEHYVYALTYHGDYTSSYPNLKDWSAIFVSESP